MKKRILSLMLCGVLALALFAGCSVKNETTDGKKTDDTKKTEEVTPADIRIGGLQGPTSMGLVKLLEDNANGKAFNHYDFYVTAAIDEMSAKIIKGELDIAAIPVNMASVLYQKTNGQVQALAINTLGVMYIVERGNTLDSLTDLKGKTIYSTGKGATPEYVLNYLLKQNGLEPGKDVKIEFKSETTEIVALLQQNPTAIALLPQPFVAVAQSKLTDLRVAIDLNNEWEALKNGSQLLTGVFVVRKDFAEQYPEQINKFLEEYQASVAYVNNTDHVDEASALIEKFGIVKAAIAKQALPQCSVVFMAGKEMKSTLSGYLQVLYNQDPKAVGGIMPDDAFYYAG